MSRPRKRAPARPLSTIDGALDLIGQVGPERAAEIARELSGRGAQIVFRVSPAKRRADQAAAAAAGLTLTAWPERAADAALGASTK